MTRNSQHGTQKPSAWYALGLKKVFGQFLLHTQRTTPYWVIQKDSVFILKNNKMTVGIGTNVPGLFKARTGNLLRNWAEQQSKVRDLGMDWWSDRDWNPGPWG